MHAEGWGGRQSNRESSRLRASPLLGRVVRRFARDHYIVHVAFAETGGADTHKSRLLLQFGDGLAATISHAGPEAAHQLMNDHRYRTAVGDTPLDSFWHQFTQAVRIFT